MAEATRSGPISDKDLQTRIDGLPVNEFIHFGQTVKEIGGTAAGGVVQIELAPRGVLTVNEEEFSPPRWFDGEPVAIVLGASAVFLFADLGIDISRPLLGRVFERVRKTTGSAGYACEWATKLGLLIPQPRQPGKRFVTHTTPSFCITDRRNESDVQSALTVGGWRELIGLTEPGSSLIDQPETTSQPETQKFTPWDHLHTTTINYYGKSKLLSPRPEPTGLQQTPLVMHDLTNLMLGEEFYPKRSANGSIKNFVALNTVLDYLDRGEATIERRDIVSALRAANISRGDARRAIEWLKRGGAISSTPQSEVYLLHPISIKDHRRKADVDQTPTIGTIQQAKQAASNPEPPIAIAPETIHGVCFWGSDAEMDELIEKARIAGSKQKTAKPFLQGLHDVVSDENYDYDHPQVHDRFGRLWRALHEPAPPRPRRRSKKSD